MSYSLSCSCGCGNSIIFRTGSNKKVVYAYPQVSCINALNEKSFKKEMVKRAKKQESLHEVLLTKEDIEEFLIWIAQVYYDLEFVEPLYSEDSYFTIEYEDDIDTFNLNLFPSVDSKVSNKNISSFFDITITKSELDDLFKRIKIVYNEAYEEENSRNSVDLEELLTSTKENLERLNRTFNELKNKYGKKKQILLESKRTY